MVSQAHIEHQQTQENPDGVIRDLLILPPTRIEYYLIRVMCVHFTEWQSLVARSQSEAEANMREEIVVIFVASVTRTMSRGLSSNSNDAAQ